MSFLTAVSFEMWRCFPRVDQVALWLRAAELCTFPQKAEMFPDFSNIPPSTDLDEFFAFLSIKDLISLYAAVRIGINFGWQLKMAANQSSRRTDMELHKL